MDHCGVHKSPNDLQMNFLILKAYRDSIKPMFRLKGESNILILQLC